VRSGNVIEEDQILSRAFDAQEELDVHVHGTPMSVVSTAWMCCYRAQLPAKLRGFRWCYTVLKSSSVSPVAVVLTCSFWDRTLAARLRSS
jgi:hypothetical protein